MTLILMKYNATTRNNAEGGSTNCLMESFKSFQNFQMGKQKLIKHNQMQVRIQKTVVKKMKCSRKSGE